MRRSSGFTLIELLIVVAIIAILAAIAVPNFLEAQVRAKVTRAKADMRSIGAALGSYATDHGGYIWSAHNNTHYETPYRVDMFQWYRKLTSPVSYISTIPRDPFDPADAGGMPGSDFYLYYSGCLSGQYNVYAKRILYVLTCIGPDLKNNVRDLQSQTGVDYIIDDTHWDTTNGFPYDATNGSKSRGDIYRFSTGGPLTYSSSYPGAEPGQFLRY